MNRNAEHVSGERFDKSDRSARLLRTLKYVEGAGEAGIRPEDLARRLGLAEIARHAAGSGDENTADLTLAQRIFLFTRADTIYGGSNQIQRNVIGERALGLPPEPKVV